MTRLLIKRLLQGALVVVVLQTITFFLVRLLPGRSEEHTSELQSR